MTDDLDVGVGMDNQSQFMVDQKESIKLTRGQKGGYGWEVKILSLDVDELVKIDNKLKEKFGDAK
jgi:hypothetical protein